MTAGVVPINAILRRQHVVYLRQGKAADTGV